MRTPIHPRFPRFLGGFLLLSWLLALTFVPASARAQEAAATVPASVVSKGDPIAEIKEFQERQKAWEAYLMTQQERGSHRAFWWIPLACLAVLYWAAPVNPQETPDWGERQYERYFFVVMLVVALPVHALFVPLTLFFSWCEPCLEGIASLSARVVLFLVGILGLNWGYVREAFSFGGSNVSQLHSGMGKQPTAAPGKPESSSPMAEKEESTLKGYETTGEEAPPEAPLSSRERLPWHFTPLPPEARRPEPPGRPPFHYGERPHKAICRECSERYQDENLDYCAECGQPVCFRCDDEHVNHCYLPRTLERLEYQLEGMDWSAVSEDVLGVVRNQYVPETWLRAAVKRGLNRSALVLLALGADPLAMSHGKGAAESPFGLAVIRGNEALVESMLAQGADPLWRFPADYFMPIPLWLALFQGHPGTLSLLMKRVPPGGLPRVERNHLVEGALNHAVSLRFRGMDIPGGGPGSAGMERALEIFIGHFGVPDIVSESLPDTASGQLSKGSRVSLPILWSAAALGFESLTRTLLSLKAQVDAPGVEGMTPLMAAAREGYGVVVTLLIEAGADVRARDNRGRSANTVACEELARLEVEPGERDRERAARLRELLPLLEGGYPGAEGGKEMENG